MLLFTSSRTPSILLHVTKKNGGTCIILDITVLELNSDLLLNAHVFVSRHQTNKKGLREHYLLDIFLFYHWYLKPQVASETRCDDSWLLISLRSTIKQS